MYMKKFKEFKEIATNVGILLKKYWFYKQNLKSYLTTKEFSEEAIQKIEKDLSLNLQLETYIEEFGEDSTQEESRTALIKLLMIESFYNNHELFKKLNEKYKKFNLPKDFREMIFKRSFNELVKTINYQELEKNINLLEKDDMKLVVLEKAYLSSDKQLYKFISPLINWVEDEKIIKNSLIRMLIKHGVKLVGSSFSNEIKNYIKKDDLINFFTKENGYFLDKKVANNIDIFFKSDMLFELINNEEINKELSFYSYSKDKKEFKHIITKIDRTKDYTHIIENYMTVNFKGMEIKDKIILLNKEGLLTEDIWNKIIKKKNKDLLNLIFMKQQQLLPYLSKEILNKVKLEYKSVLEEISHDKDLVKDFIENFSEKLEKEELITLLTKRYSFNKHDDDNKKENQKESDLVNYLFENYEQIMIQEESILKITNKTKNELFIKYYLSKLFKTLKNETTIDNIIDKNNKELLKVIFNNQECFNALSSSNQERLLKEYKDVILNYSYDISEVLNFIEKYPYKLNHEELNNLLEKTNNYLKLVSPSEKKATNLVKEKYPDQLNIENMQSSYDFNLENYLVEERKLIDCCFEKYAGYLNDHEMLLKISTSSSNDIFLSTYLSKYFEENNDEELKKMVVKKLVIFEQGSFGNTLEWVINNNLLQELLPINEYVSMDRNLLTNKAWNGWIPLMIEGFNINPDALIKQTVASYISNDELFKFILNNYELKPKTQQYLCNSVFAIDAEDLAKELFRNGVVPNEYYAEKFKNSPTNAGNILLKAKLKEKLENNFETVSEENKTKKVKKI